MNLPPQDIEPMASPFAQIKREIARKAGQDAAFHDALKSNPKATIETYFELPAGTLDPVSFEFFEEKPQTISILIPPRPTDVGEELSEAQLEAVAGGNFAAGISVVYDSMGATSRSLEGNIRSYQQTMDPNSQMDLIQLQKYMQDWTIQTQMQSNVVKSMGDALKNTVSNLR